MAKPIIVSWSGGKDSTLALYEIINNKDYEVEALITTVTENYDRISIHGVRNELLEKQAASIGIPLKKVLIPKDCTNEQYETALKSILLDFKEQGINEIVFGDIFLEDVKKYRDNLLASLHMKGIYPIWKMYSKELAAKFIELGFKAITTFVDSQQIDKRFVGREYNYEFLEYLPETADPCGENDEFHTFVYDGPLFNQRIEFNKGEIVFRDLRFHYCDLIPD
ncbi:MAG: diphthine--ammonia ligase [Candidatus Dadabacteria bacterium]|nr:diphthine--ammonia ligase [Candidatus Dadabacteria bacterium]NIS08541.1 diphthine--ammonia ligase [Candidatus Dadabacteria bacterium]NIV41369.1 diphthine--ammonia ligase [Candidatus Dadabacteria bacterium]NIX14576.1 diphthine--ammonia ligase [Candidatus Dadabacteria bacterium]NIY21031.1 diphthine--ammonia ligase [Candidatus Dadabacteria bacterium]